MHRRVVGMCQALNKHELSGLCTPVKWWLLPHCTDEKTEARDGSECPRAWSLQVVEQE